MISSTIKEQQNTKKIELSTKAHSKEELELWNSYIGEKDIGNTLHDSPQLAAVGPQYYYGNMGTVPVTPPMIVHYGMHPQSPMQMQSQMYPFQDASCVYFVPHYIPVYIDQSGNIAHENIEEVQNEEDEKDHNLDDSANEDTEESLKNDEDCKAEDESTEDEGD